MGDLIQFSQAHGLGPRGASLTVFHFTQQRTDPPCRSTSPARATAAGEERTRARTGWFLKAIRPIQLTRIRSGLECVRRSEWWADAAVVIVPRNAWLVFCPARAGSLNTTKRRPRRIVQAGQSIAVERWARIEPEHGINAIGVHASCGTHPWRFDDPGHGECDVEAESRAASRSGIASRREQ